ncbi:MAG: hypothetical protein ACLQDC_04690 [Verrucomicrobiia bacterium]
MVTVTLRAEAETYKLYVNDTPVEANVIETNGALYVPLLAVAKGFGAEVAIKADEIRITSSAKPDDKTAGSAKSAEAAQGFGAIKGTVTYFFNENYGDKPDAGATVTLLTNEQAVRIQKSTGGTDNDPIPERTSPDTLPFMQGPYNFKETKADGSGNFSFDRIPVGRYLVVSRSAHSNGSPKRDLIGKMHCTFVEVKAGETVDVSHSFGMSDF